MKRLGQAGTIIAFLAMLELTVRAAAFITAQISAEIPSGLGRYAGAIAPFMVLGAASIFLEWIRPRTAAPRHYATALLFSLVYIVTVTFYMTWIREALNLIPGRSSLVLYVAEDSGYSGTGMAAVLILAYAVIYDFLVYWYHRAQHRFDCLWRFHRVHHAMNPMNGLNSYHHIAEELIKVPMVTLPLLFIPQIDMPHILILSAYLSALSFIVHADTAVDIGPLRYIFTDNLVHRLHHESESVRVSNFASIFPLWDRIFGTYRAPKEGEWPDVGLSDAAPPTTLKDYFLMPFKKSA